MSRNSEQLIEHLHDKIDLLESDLESSRKETHRLRSKLAELEGLLTPALRLKLAIRRLKKRLRSR